MTSRQFSERTSTATETQTHDKENDSESKIAAMKYLTETLHPKK